MEDYQHLRDEDLVDLLAAATANYTKYVNQSRSSQQFIDSKEVMKSLLSEMDRRKEIYVHSTPLEATINKVELK